MVEYYIGDIFEAPVDIVIHQSNCHCTFGRGIAKEIKQRFPEAYTADCQTKKGDRSKLGTYSFARVNREKEGVRISYVFNMYSQYNYAGAAVHTDYQAMKKALLAIRNSIANTKLVIGIPYKIGCGLGGGDWDTVESIIRDVFEDSVFQVLICQREEDQ